MIFFNLGPREPREKTVESLARAGWRFLALVVFLIALVGLLELLGAA